MFANIDWPMNSAAVTELLKVPPYLSLHSSALYHIIEIYSTYSILCFYSMHNLTILSWLVPIKLFKWSILSEKKKVTFWLQRERAVLFENEKWLGCLWFVPLPSSFPLSTALTLSHRNSLLHMCVNWKWATKPAHSGLDWSNLVLSGCDWGQLIYIHYSLHHNRVLTLVF